MHSWARHLVGEAQRQVRSSYEYSQSTLLTSSASDTSTLSSAPNHQHRDEDLHHTQPLLTTTHHSPSPTRGPHRARRSTPELEEPETDDDSVQPPSRQLLETATASPFSPLSSKVPIRPFYHDKSLHPSIRNHTFRYASSLSPASIPSFFALTPDGPTAAFLTECADEFHSSSRCSRYYFLHTVAKPLVSLCLSHTNVNGLLGTGEMFLLSSAQFNRLWQHHSMDPSAPSTTSTGDLLDVGAGSGNTTAQIAPLFQSTTATEVSWMMCQRLSMRGYQVYHTGTLDRLPAALRYECILCFNVLDRCSHPRRLLQQLKGRLRSLHSRLFLATPLPLDPWFESGKRWVEPEERLALGGEEGKCVCCMSWEESVERLSLLLLGMGFLVLSVSRLPYVSAGNTHKPFFVLDDALFVLSLADEPSATPAKEVD